MMEFDETMGNFLLGVAAIGVGAVLLAVAVTVMVGAALRGKNK